MLYLANSLPSHPSHHQHVLSVTNSCRSCSSLYFGNAQVDNLSFFSYLLLLSIHPVPASCLFPIPLFRAFRREAYCIRRLRYKYLMAYYTFLRLNHFLHIIHLPLSAILRLLCNIRLLLLHYCLPPIFANSSFNRS